MSLVERQLDQVIAEYLERIDLGENVDPNEIIEKYPQFADEVLQFIDVQNQVDEALDASDLLEAIESIDLKTVAADQLNEVGLQIGEEVGRGGMGVVHKAVKTETGETLAVKILHPTLSGNPHRLERFRKEAEIAARCTGSNVIPVLDIVDTGLQIIVMPFVEGIPLRDLIRRPLGQTRTHKTSWDSISQPEYEQRVLKIAKQVIDALVDIHQQGILHRDIKPGNILVDPQNDAWLMDFGLACLVDGDISLTVTGDILGTLGYISPEQYTAITSIDERADIFSLGASIYEALTGVAPYGKQFVSLSAPEPAPPSKLRPHSLRGLDDVVLKMIATDRDQRYDNALELQADWGRMLNNAQTEAERQRSREQRSYLFKRFSPSMMLLALIVILAALLIFDERRKVRYGDLFAGAGERLMKFETDPPGAKLAFVPLDPKTGDLIPERLVHSHGGTPQVKSLAPGEYLVTAYLPENHQIFQEVYRKVAPLNAGEKQAASWLSQLFGGQQPLQTQVIKLSDTAELGSRQWGRVYEEAGKDAKASKEVRSRRGFVFLFDASLKSASTLPASRFDEAEQQVELLGTRLPDRAEFELMVAKNLLKPVVDGVLKVENQPGVKIGWWIRSVEDHEVAGSSEAERTPFIAVLDEHGGVSFRKATMESTAYAVPVRSLNARFERKNFSGESP